MYYHEVTKTQRKPETDVSSRIPSLQWISNHFNSAYLNSTSILELHFLLFVPSCLRGEMPGFPQHALRSANSGKQLAMQSHNIRQVGCRFLHPRSWSWSAEIGRASCRE